MKRSRLRGGPADFAALLLVLCLAAACRVPAARVWVRGIVLDPESLQPLPEVLVRARDGEARTDRTGEYALQIRVGVRALDFSAAGRPAVRKFLVTANASDQRLDALLPKEAPTDRAIVAGRLAYLDRDLPGTTES